MLTERFVDTIFYFDAQSFNFAGSFYPRMFPKFRVGIQHRIFAFCRPVFIRHVLYMEYGPSDLRLSLFCKGPWPAYYLSSERIFGMYTLCITAGHSAPCSSLSRGFFWHVVYVQFDILTCKHSTFRVDIRRECFNLFFSVTSAGVPLSTCLSMDIHTIHLST